jgi:hypothetical protein
MFRGRPLFHVDLNRRVRGNQTTIPSLGADVEVGQRVWLHDNGEPGTVWTGIVRSIEGPRVYVEVEFESARQETDQP